MGSCTNKHNMAHKNEPAKEIYVFKIKQPDIVSGCSYIILILKNLKQTNREIQIAFRQQQILF